VLENAPDINVAISPSAPRFVTDVLQILKVSNIKEVRVLRPEKFVLVTSQYASGLPSRSDLEKIRNLGKFSRVNQPKGTDSHPKKIYISRRKSRRPIKDEIKVEESAKKWGYAVVFLEDFNLADEIELFSQVEEVIGPMGAGFFNLIWATSSRVKRVIEISHPSQINDTFGILAEDLGIPFERVLYKNLDFIDEIFIN
jgi:capsular polysaccharide biosynthesis protein